MKLIEAIARTVFEGTEEECKEKFIELHKADPMRRFIVRDN